MKAITECGFVKPQRPIRVVQFGEGNFLRAFVDYMIDIANETSDFNGSIALVRPVAYGTLDRFDRQDRLYTVVLRGMENGQTVNKPRVITSVNCAVDGAETWEHLSALAQCETVRFIVSNTTEAGIVLDESDTMDGVPATYPGKLTKFLYERFTAFSGAPERGVIILPVELIENNGDKLRTCVLRLAEIWGLPAEFTAWLTESCTFCSTLVDRIVTGYPATEADKICAELGYKDELLDVGEPFGLWVIESDREIREELPLDRLGLPVVFTKDQRPFRERKVRILNGAHTASVLAAWLAGKTIVREMMQDDICGTFVRRTVREEIAPFVPLDAAEVESFASAVFERFENPFIDHALLSISLNSVSKWRARVLPSLRDYVAKNGALPQKLTFSFAALLAFYTSDDLREDGLHACRADGTEYIVRDDRSVLEFFAAHSKLPAEEYVQAAAARTDFWGEDLTQIPGFVESVTKSLDALRENPTAAIRHTLG